jgi:hypothetical protein
MLPAVRVLAVPMDDKGACTFYRVTEPARCARDLGVEVGVTGTLECWAELNSDGSWDVYEFRHDADILWMQRPLAQSAWAIARQAQRQGIKLVVELDDLLHKLHAQNTMTYWIDPKRYPNHNYEWSLRVIAMADALTVSTPELAAQYHKPGRPAFVLRNWLPERALTLRPDTNPARDYLGWTGALNVHPTDLQDTRGALRAVKAPFRMIGNPTGVGRALRVPQARIESSADWIEDIEDYWRVEAVAFGVGICPLETSVFNRCKSWIKPVEMLNLGIVPVCSPLPEYVDLAEQAPGAVFIARGQADWVRHLRRLTSDDAAYTAARQAGLEWAQANTLEHHAQEWVDAWEQILAL